MSSTAATTATTSTPVQMNGGYLQIGQNPVFVGKARLNNSKFHDPSVFSNKFEEQDTNIYSLPSWEITPTEVKQLHTARDFIHTTEIPLDSMKAIEEWMKGSSLETFKALRHYYTKEDYAAAKTNCKYFLNQILDKAEWDSVNGCLQATIDLYGEMGEMDKATEAQMKQLYENALVLFAKAREIYDNDPTSPDLVQFHRGFGAVIFTKIVSGKCS